MRRSTYVALSALAGVAFCGWLLAILPSDDTLKQRAKAEPHTPADLQLRNPNTNEVLVLHHVTVRGVPCVVLSHFRGNALSCDWSKP